MRKLLVILFSLICSITYSQGVGYLNYVTYLTHNNTGATNQYPQFANSATDFVNMFNTANSNTTIYSQGVGTAAHTLIVDGSYAGGVPRNNYWGVKVTGYFIPKESGTYYFGIDGDDGVDLSINGNVVTSFYGGHGFNGYRIGSISLTAGTTYTIMARFQQYGGGWGMSVVRKRPSQGSYSTQSHECSTSPGNPRTEKINFNFAGSFNQSSFAFNTVTKSNNVWSVSSRNTLSNLTSSGVGDISNYLDTTKIGSGYNAGITTGQVEWSYVDLSNNSATLYIDLRQFGGVTPSSVNSVSILDVYDGAVTYAGSNIYWAYYTLPSIPTKVTDGTSTYNSYIRNAGYNNYAFKCNVAITQTQTYKEHGVQFKALTSDSLNAILNRVVTIADVYLAFKEYSAGGGLFGTGGSTYFSSGIQYMNADVDNNGIFDERDCFRLLQHLTGQKSLLDTAVLENFMKIADSTDYNSVTKANWMTKDNSTTNLYDGIILKDAPNLSHTYYPNVYWKGDVNMSHSPAQTGQYANTSVSNTMRISTMSIGVSTEIDYTFETELIGDSIVATIKVNPNQNQLTGVQFSLNYDKSISYSSTSFVTKGTPTNFAKNTGNSVSVGSLNTSGGTLDNTTTYRVSFKNTSGNTNILGLVTISNYEGIDINGNNLNVKIQ